MLFFPNEQNLAGLCQIARSVREKGARGKDIELLYVASRIPKLDDEHGVLKTWLGRFQRELNYKDEDLAVLEHYDSLSLLNQVIFSISRPKSGLAIQYKSLAALISQRNMEDASGAFQFVSAINRRDRTSSPETDMADDQFTTKLNTISKNHEDDFVIQFELAKAYYSRRQIFECLVATDQSLTHFGQTRTSASPKSSYHAAIHHLRLRAFTEIGSYDEVAQSARAILSDEHATETYVLDAILALANTDPELLGDVRELAALKSAGPATLANIAIKLFASTTAANFSAQLLEIALRSATPWAPDHEDLVQSQLILIAGGKFRVALDLTTKCDPDWPSDLATAFNYCMALWGSDGHPPIDAIKSIIPHFDGYLEADQGNLQQCLALCFAVLGQERKMDTALKASRRAIQISNRRQFSCWTYSNVPPAEFESHLDMIRQFGTGKGAEPEFLARAWEGQPPT